MQPKFQDLYNRHSAFALDQQLLLASLIGDLPWSYNLSTGTLSFGDRFAWHAEILGTESAESSTWLWAWANEESNIPIEQQRTSLKLKAIGEEHGIAELTEPMVPLDNADGFAFASIAVGEGMGKAYYRGPYEGGAVFLLITADRLQFQVDEPLQRILTVFPQVISNLEIEDHKTALTSYLSHYGFEAVAGESSLSVRVADEELLHAQFDEFGRLQELRGTIEKKHQA